MTDSDLFKGILSDARKQAESIIEEARKQASGLTEKGKEDQALALQKEDALQQRRLELLETKYVSLSNAAKNRQNLEQQALRVRLAMEVLKKKLDSLPKDPNYPQYLLSWIVEGTIGLPGTEVYVNCGKNDPVDEAMLEKASKLVLEKTGRDVRIKMNFKGLAENGIIVTTADKKVSFNNQISARVRRFKEEVNEMMDEIR